MREENELSERETEIVQLIAKGSSSARIASQLSLSIHTVNTHRRNIHRKLGTTGMAQMMAEARNRGILT